MSSDLNHVTMIGRLTRDAELKFTSGGMAVCKFAIAVNRKTKKGESWVDEASFFDVTLWGKSGEAVSQYLVKGKQIGVQGSLVQNRWEQDGQTRSKIEIMADNVQLLGGAESGQGAPQKHQDGDGYQKPAQGARTAPSRQAPAESQADARPEFADDIPF